MDSTETYISLYSGGAGLDLGFKRVRPDAECVSYVEHEASAAALLVDHVEAELLDAAPVFTDAFTFPAGKFHGLVDWIIGGPPCQPFSVAGKQLGAADPRNLWPLTLRMVAEIQPRGCFFENVPSADSLWYVYENVIPGLQHLGYEVAAGIFSAAEVGAPHNRERIFILANSRRLSGQVPQAGEPDRTQRDAAAGASGELEHPADNAPITRRVRSMADTARSQRVRETGARASGQRWQEQRSGRVSGNVGHTGLDARSTEQRQQPEVTGGGTGEPGDATVGDTDQQGSQGRHESIGERRNERPAWPPGPTGDWSSIPERLWPAVKPGFRGVADGFSGTLDGLSRSQKLRILGNAVVASTAERAFIVLAEELNT